ncbi:two-component system sensor histidine kinase NtrB [Aestuariivirga litoralis]|uniref:two-component system sensor histidine kinase NtrB n=1 Tax=Aestuariivirga litoralis TaxID=2650924 RepID=UPI0018C59643|nr:ATP-binding protein [Aestuariivirga litoralis]MBG1231570.1 PAS domain-containing protein [Aestuariivirga litoralis]
MIADEQLARSILEALPNPLLLVDGKNRIAMVNSACEDFFQASATMLRKNTAEDLFPFSSPALEAIARARDEGGVINEYATSIGTPRFGGERIVDVQTTGLGDMPGTVLIIILRQSMAQKFDFQLSHRGAARSVSGMAAMLAHEIKNPLFGIRGAAQLLEPTVGPQDRSLTRLICDETDRIRNLVDQMEVFSDERPLERQPVNIHVVLDRVRQIILAANPNGVTLTENYDPSLPPVSGNHDQLVQVFLNLAKNAVEAMNSDQGGKLEFTTAFRPGVKLAVPGSSERVSLPLEVCVNDDGPGVEEELRPFIFDPFITSKAQGKGLGLALVAKIVRDHGGVVECIGRERGATFRVLLPLEKRVEKAD